MPPFLRKIEHGGQHHRRQVNGDFGDPIERFPNLDAVQHARSPLADHRFMFTQARAIGDRGDGAAGAGMFWRVHGDERGAVMLRRDIVQLNAAQLCFAGEDPGVQFNFHDVRVGGDRPERPIGAFPAIMHWRFISQSLEIGPPRIMLVKCGITDVDLRSLEQPQPYPLQS